MTAFLTLAEEELLDATRANPSDYKNVRTLLLETSELVEEARGIYSDMDWSWQARVDGAVGTLWCTASSATLTRVMAAFGKLEQLIFPAQHVPVTAVRPLVRKSPRRTHSNTGAKA